MAQDATALVTGAPGWLGNRLLRYLVEPHPDYPPEAPPVRFGHVRCLLRPGDSRDRLEEIHPGAEIVEGDIRDPAAVGRFCAGAEGATLFHLAGVIHPRRVRDLYEINVDGTRHLIAAAAASGLRRIVAVSSNSPIGASRDHAAVFDESAPYRPYSAYGHSKKLMEDALNEAHRAGAIEAVILRPCWFYGPDQPPRQTLFFRMIKEGKAPIVGSGGVGRSMSYVDNTALGLLLAAATDRAGGETYWMADERPYSMDEIVDTVEELLEQEFGMPVAHRRLRLPSVAGEGAHAVDRFLQRVGLYQQKIHVLGLMHQTISCSIEKARRELGYRPSIGLREGMRRSIEWCLATGQTI